jgi:hypothetical protein
MRLEWRVLEAMTGNLSGSLKRTGAYSSLALLTLFIALGVFSHVAPVRAATIAATSCSSSAVQSAINSASTGDTVSVPAGTCTWTSAVNINKTVTLLGATTCSGWPLTCTDRTIINTSVQAIRVSSSSSAFVTLGGLTLNMSGGDPNNGGIAFSGTEFTVSFRFHHSHVVITGSAGMVGAIANWGTYGVMDHLLIDNSASSNHTMSIQGDWANAGFIAWQKPLSFGTNNAMYVEDSVFNLANQTDGLIDGFTGGRLVFRNNIVIFTGSSNGADSLGFHGTDSGSYRSFFSAEIYNNTFTNNASGPLTALRLRGGTAVMYGNTFNGTKGWNGANLQNYRADGGGNTSQWGNCNGTNWKLMSIDPTTSAGRTNSASGTVFWCAINRDTPATSNTTCSALTPGDTATAYFDGNPDGSGAPGSACRDNPGRTHNQALAPVYVWMNTPNLSVSSSDAASYIVANRDYYAHTTSFTGASGVGSGTFASRPSTCTVGVGFWATDRSTLYQCGASNTWTTYYAPYTYPHPLTTGGGSTTLPPPSAPGNLRIIK